MRFNPRIVVLVAAITLAYEISSEAFAQGGKRPGGIQNQVGGKVMNGRKKGGGQGKANGDESPSAHLPPGFQELSRDEVKQLDSLCNRFINWIADSKSRERASLLSIGDYFGAMDTPKERNNNADGNPRISETDIGFYVLSLLTSDQRSQLAKLVVSQRAAIADYERHRADILAQLKSVPTNETSERGFDRAIAESARAVGQLEISIAVAQARVFADIFKVLTAEQREFLILVRSNPIAINYNNGSIAAVRETLATHDVKDQEAIAVLAYKAACFCTGTATQNAASLPSMNAGLVGNQSSGGDKEGRATGALLSALTPTQQQSMYQLLANQVKTLMTQSIQRRQVVLALDASKTGNSMVERKLQQIGGQISQTDAQSAVNEVRTFALIKRSLTEPQRLFIQQNFVPTVSENP
ncbi:MAG: hypothetical protein H6822_22575 [Planctomycetaceae bacterium]|nr:hypothetical protein [Planctomycetales bacterium]MCB9924981.1 hypothetical protein [Planctomycetaceae bacterium]